MNLGDCYADDRDRRDSYADMQQRNSFYVVVLANDTPNPLAKESDEEKAALYSPDVRRSLAGTSTREHVRLAFEGLTARDPLNRMLEAEFRDVHNLTAIAVAVRNGEAEAARAAGQRHVEIGRQALERALDTVERQGGRL